ncbi:hypothetical protein GP486_004242 [Trichoglossum hirsutum]|uniref:Uncharacterized protein n=1 Tax=Trichoglossum hirsutum TaxID=265104 RepID=A0A9P8RQ12_9PEZI|nr:hypothetical protein GP486_004242 [Trichoglossum hirsutum]
MPPQEPGAEPGAEPGDVRYGGCSSTASPVRSKLTLCVATPTHAQSGRSGSVEPMMTLDDLIAKSRPPVGRGDNSNRANKVLNGTPHVVQPNHQSTRTTSPILLYGLSNSHRGVLQGPPPPRHPARVDPTPSSGKSRPLPRSPWAGKEKPELRAFAPGLAMKKPKVDPYASLGSALSKQSFSMAADLAVPEIRGTWTTIDRDTNVLGFDRLWHKERNKDKSATDAGRAEKIDNGGSSMAVAPSPSTTIRMSEGEESNHEILDDRFENPDIDIDEDIRKKFLSVKEVTTERPPPGSLLEHRNPFLLKSASSAPMTVIIGGRVAKVLKPKADLRGEFQDRFGNYVGENLGRMKKHLIEDRQMKIRLRDEEMVEATKQKRAFEALGPEEREVAIAKRQVPMGFITGGQGAAPADIFEFSDIPEVYLRPVLENTSARRNRSTTLPRQSVTDKASSSKPSVTGKSDASSRTRETTTSSGSGFHPIEEFDSSYLAQKDAHQPTPASGTSNSTVRATGANTVSISTTRKSRGRKIQTTISSTDPSGVPSLVDEDPDLVHPEDVEDIPGEYIPENSDAKADVWTKLRKTSLIRGRVVSVTLHDPVHFTPGAVMERVFGGIIQEVQFHPKERIALVVFVFPAEAEDFVRHVKAMKENNYQEHRRLQIDADWYKGSEHNAVYPLTYQIALRVIGDDTRRVLGVNGIPLQKKKEQVNEELKLNLGKLMVKVGLMTSNKRYVRERDGKMAIIEFSSIRDAVEAMRLFSAGIFTCIITRASESDRICEEPKRTKLLLRAFVQVDKIDLTRMF